MPLTINKLFEIITTEKVYKVKWETAPHFNIPGVYAVSLSDNPDENLNIMPTPSFDVHQTLAWIKTCPKIQMDDAKVSNFKLLQERLAQFWFHNENIFYIGKAGTSLRTRVSQYYSTKIGAGSPHSGGQWIKTLSNLNESYVYYCQSAQPDVDEEKMLHFFMDKISESTKEKLRDPYLPLPFANIRHLGKDKNHGLTNQRG